MFKRMVFTMMFKIGIGLGLMLGIASYAQYLSGGDPGSVWRRVGGGVATSVGNSVGGLRDRLEDAVDGAGSMSAGWMGQGQDDVSTSSQDGGDGMTQVWTWQDASGGTHYSNAPPAGQASTRLAVDPNVNVLAPVVDQSLRTAGAGDRMPIGGRSADAPSSGALSRGVPDLQQPGIAGALQRARGDGPAPDPARAEALLKLLQSVN